MGHLTNPIGFRAGRTQTWKGLWASSPALYSSQEQVVGRITQYFKLFFGFILGDMFRDKGLGYSHIWLRSKLKRVVITIFLYSANLVKFQKLRNLKYISFVHRSKSLSSKGGRIVESHSKKVKTFLRKKKLKKVKKMSKFLFKYEKRK